MGIFFVSRYARGYAPSGHVRTLASVDRHAIWRRVEFDYKQSESRAPTGYDTVVLVYVAGRATPLEPIFVETHRAPDDMWIRFQVSGPDKDGGSDDPLPSDSAWVHVPEGCILGVEVSFRAAATERRRPVGFSYTESADE
jgi:hypothetical protein